MIYLEKPQNREITVNQYHDKNLQRVYFEHILPSLLLNIAVANLLPATARSLSMLSLAENESEM